MDKPEQTASRSVDVTGLSEAAVRQVEALVNYLRSQEEPHPLHTSPFEEWANALQEWVDSHPRRDTLADDSRESIYAGRGD
jgi:hypothetical protein